MKLGALGFEIGARIDFLVIQTFVVINVWNCLFEDKSPKGKYKIKFINFQF